MDITEEDFELGYITYEEKSDYLIDSTSKATYKYDAADRLLSDGNDSYSYDAFGRKVSRMELKLNRGDIKNGKLYIYRACLR